MGDVPRSRLLLGIAAVLSGTAVLFVILGAVFNLVLIPLAIPFGLAAYFIWQDATGKLTERVRQQHHHQAASRVGRRASGTGSRAQRARGGSVAAPRQVEWARGVLSVEAGADPETLRAAYRERVKDVHPDADDGDEAAFKEVTEAYELLRDHSAD